MSFVKDTKEVFRETGLHFRTGVSYMLPILLIGGLLGSVSMLGTNSDAEIWKVLKHIGEIGMSFFVPMMAAYIAYSMADTPGLAPGFIVGILANETQSGYLGALLGGILVGYITFMLLKIELPKLWQSSWGMVIPVVSTTIVSLFLVFIVGPPLAIMMESMSVFFSNLSESGGAALGGIMGILGGFDYGGPFSKTQSTFATAAMDLNVFTPLGITGAIVTIPPLGLCLATFLSPKLYTKTEKDYAKSSWLYSLIAGFTEIAIPLAMNDLIRATVATVAGCLVGGSIAGFFALELYTPVLGIPQWFFYNNIYVYIGSVVSGVITTALLVNLLKSISNRDIKAIEASEESI